MPISLYAVLSDIHANYQALRAVVADAVRVRQAHKAKNLHFVVLGDVVDYGPQPNECMSWVASHAEIIIQGNHDLDVADPMHQRPRYVAPIYWPFTTWTRMVLKQEHKMRIREGNGAKWQPGLCVHNADLPRGLEPFMLFHSSLKYGHQAYIDSASKAWENLQCLESDLMYGLFGHSHVQSYFVDDPLRKRTLDERTTTMHLICPEETNLAEVKKTGHWEPDILQPTKQQPGVGETPWADLPPFPTLFNPGAVGQPRPHGPARVYAPHDNRANYMLLKFNSKMQFQFRRVAYDFQETIRRLREDVTWPPPPHTRKRGSDILKLDGPAPYSRDARKTLILDYWQSLNSSPELLPKLIDEVLVPQLK